MEYVIKNNQKKFHKRKYELFLVSLTAHSYAYLNNFLCF